MTVMEVSRPGLVSRPDFMGIGLVSVSSLKGLGLVSVSRRGGLGLEWPGLGLVSVSDDEVSVSVSVSVSDDEAETPSLLDEMKDGPVSYEVNSGDLLLSGGMITDTET